MVSAAWTARRKASFSNRFRHSLARVPEMGTPPRATAISMRSGMTPSIRLANVPPLGSFHVQTFGGKYGDESVFLSTPRPSESQSLEEYVVLPFEASSIVRDQGHSPHALQIGDDDGPPKGGYEARMHRAHDQRHGYLRVVGSGRYQAIAFQPFARTRVANEPMNVPSAWAEAFDGGSPEAENATFERLALEILSIQKANRARLEVGAPMRTLHAKIVVGVKNARLLVDRGLPRRFQMEHFTPGATFQTTVRLSNASGIPQADSAPDMRGMALRLALPDGRHHDLLMTSFPVSHARDARQFVTFATIAAGERKSMVPRLIEAFGRDETERMLWNIKQGARSCLSLATERFWSRGAILWGDAGPVRFSMRPINGAEAAVAAPTAVGGYDGLRDEFAARLARADVSYRMSLQPFVNEKVTPIEDGATEWKESASAPIDVATLTIPSQDMASEQSRNDQNSVDGMAFNPWNGPETFRPLGNLNRARKVIYGASARGWMKRSQAQR